MQKLNFMVLSTKKIKSIKILKNLDPWKKKRSSAAIFFEPFYFKIMTTPMIRRENANVFLKATEEIWWASLTPQGAAKEELKLIRKNAGK